MNAERNMLELYPEGETPDPTPNSNVIDAGTFDSSDPAPSAEETTALAVTDTNELPPGIYRNLDPSVVAKRDASGRFLKCSAAIESEEKTAAFSRGFMDSLQTVLSPRLKHWTNPHKQQWRQRFAWITADLPSTWDLVFSCYCHTHGRSRRLVLR